MTIPAILFGCVLAMLYASGFHFLRGGSIGKLILFAVLSSLGFWSGEIAGTLVHKSFWMIGPLNAGMATLGSFLLLLAGDWLSRVEIVRNSPVYLGKKMPPR